MINRVVGTLVQASPCRIFPAQPCLKERPMAFATLGIAPNLLQAVADAGYTQPAAV